MAWHLSVIQAEEEKQGTACRAGKWLLQLQNEYLQKYLVYTGIFVWRRVNLLERRGERSTCLSCGQFDHVLQVGWQCYVVLGFWEGLGAGAA